MSSWPFSTSQLLLIPQKLLLPKLLSSERSPDKSNNAKLDIAAHWADNKSKSSSTKWCQILMRVKRHTTQFNINIVQTYQITLIVSIPSLNLLTSRHYGKQFRETKTLFRSFLHDSWRFRTNQYDSRKMTKMQRSKWAIIWYYISKGFVCGNNQRIMCEWRGSLASIFENSSFVFM